MKISKRLWMTVLFLTVVLGLTLMTWSQTPAADAPSAKGATRAEVKIDNFSFGPQKLKVAVGTTVTWVNRDDVPHTVVSDDKSTFKSKALDTDEQFSFTFTKPGTYSYFCSVHPKMTGEVTVE